jgi:acetyl-CoA synthetase
VGSILDVRRWPDVRERFAWDALWPLFDGDRARLNLAHECVDRHPGERVALRVLDSGGRFVEHTFAELAEWSSRFANLLEADGIAAGDRVAIMLDPSLPFYGALFGAVKRGAVAVPLFTLFGPDGVALRVDDCQPRLLLVERDAERWQSRLPGVRVVAVDDARFVARLAEQSVRYTPRTAADDPAVFQYTSGTTRALPEAVRHTHRAVVTLMVAALYGIGLERGDRYFCPSSPAWGHGLWHGTIAPLALGIPAGALAGRFEPARFAAALETFAITNVAAAPTVYRMARAAGWKPPARIAKCSFTGEPMDVDTREFLARELGSAPRSMYGSTEVGVILVDYPGFDGYTVRPGALGSAAPGWDVAIVDEAGAPVDTGVLGEIAVRRRGGWFPVKDRGWMDADGYVHHAGRSDDVIISAGWTMSAVEIEQVLLRHPDVRDAAVIAVRDMARGQIAKAFIVADRAGDAFEREVQEWVRARLSRHEYPRAVQVIDALPRTPAGKVDRRALREREASYPQGGHT